jgi:hypothetical protein
MTILASRSQDQRILNHLFRYFVPQVVKRCRVCLTKYGHRKLPNLQSTLSPKPVGNGMWDERGFRCVGPVTDHVLYSPTVSGFRFNFPLLGDLPGQFSDTLFGLSNGDRWRTSGSGQTEGWGCLF